jgi:glycopeptide antibiotics resistance protein
VGLALSVTVEFLQLLLVPGRTTAIDDVLLNTLGAVLGQALFCRYVPRESAATATESG